jgi:hypothetical protein
MTMVVCSCCGTVPEHGSVSPLSHRGSGVTCLQVGQRAARVYSPSSRAARACR